MEQEPAASPPTNDRQEDSETANTGKPEGLDETDQTIPEHELAKELNEAEQEQTAEENSPQKSNESEQPKPEQDNSVEADDAKSTKTDEAEQNLNYDNEKFEEASAEDNAEKSEEAPAEKNDERSGEIAAENTEDQDQADNKNDKGQLGERAEQVVVTRESGHTRPMIREKQQDDTTGEKLPMHEAIEDEQTADRERENLQEAQNADEETQEQTEEDVMNKSYLNGAVRNIESVDFDMISRKRQEEKEVFQKLIDDVTRLEHEKEEQNKELGDVRVKLDVFSIELDTEKEKTQEQNERIQELESQLVETEKRHSRLQEQKTDTAATGPDTSTMDQSSLLAEEGKSNTTSSHHHQGEEQEEEIRDLHLRLKMMVEADEQKNTRVEKLEKEVHNYRSLMAKVELELGEEKLSQLKHNKNGAAATTQPKQPAKTNEVAPPAQESKACTIL